jgi:hypothetical protein
MPMNKVLSFSCQEIAFLVPFTHTVLQLSLLTLDQFLISSIFRKHSDFICLETCTLWRKLQMSEIQM